MPFFSLLVRFSIKFCNFSCILLFFQFSGLSHSFNNYVIRDLGLLCCLFLQGCCWLFLSRQCESYWSRHLFWCPDFQGRGVEQTFYRCSKNVCSVGVLEFLQTSNISSWKAPGLSNVHTWLEALFDHDVVDLTVVVSSWTVPCLASRWYVWTKCVCHLQVVVPGEFQEPQASFLGLRVPILAACALPVRACILSNLCIPVTLHYKDVFLWRLVYDFL